MFLLRLKPNKPTIKLISLLVVLATVVFALCGGMKMAQAAINPELQFQGKVTNTDGSELADGVYDFQFGLYTVPSGGTAIWSETLSSSTRFAATISSLSVGASTTVISYSGASATTTLRAGQYLYNTAAGEAALIVDYGTATNTVTVNGSSLTWSAGEAINNRSYIEGGVINEKLGTVSDLTGVDFYQPLYLEVIFNGETMRPRKRIAAAAQAFEAARLGGHLAEDFAALPDNEIVTGAWSFANAVNISTSSANTILTVTQNGSGNIAEFKYGASTSLALLPDGRVRIGDYTFPASSAGASPGYVLKINAAGNMYWDVDFAGSGGGSGLWASSSNGLFIYESDTGDIVVFGNNATTSPFGDTLDVTGGAWFDNVKISNQQTLLFYDADNSNYTALRATGTLSDNFTLTLPADAGASGQALMTDGSGNLSWGTPTGAGSVGAGTVGQMPWYASAGSALTATSAIFLDTSGYVGIGSTSPSKLLSVSGSGAFNELCLNGSCISNWSSAGSVSGSGTAGQPAYWVNGNTLGATSTISTVYGGTGQNFSSATGFIYLDNGLASASSTIAISRTDLAAASGINLNGNILTLDTSGNWSGTFDSYEAADFFKLADWYSTTTDALAEGTVNLYWTNNRFDVRLSATTSLPNLTTLENLATVGTIISGTWTGDVIGVAYGGTGTSTWSQYAIPYAAASNTLAEIPIGNSGYLLMVNNDGTGYTWVASSTAGVDTWRTDEEIEDVAGAMIATTSLISVTYYDNGSAHGKITYLVNPDLSQYDNSTSAFFSTTTDILAVAYGGTGTSTFQADSLVYASADNTLGQILPGPNGYALVMSGGTPTWSSTTPGAAHPLLGSQHLDTNASANPVRGDLIAYTSAGQWDRLALGLSGYVLYSDGSDPIWRSYELLFAAELAGTTTDALAEGAVNRYYHTALFAADLAATTTDAVSEGLNNLYWTQARFAAALAATTTDALAEGSNNLYWTNDRFDARLSATTSLPNLTTLENLATVGTITSGAWQGDMIAVAYGGTGTSTWPANSLVYASSDNVLDHINPGTNGYALVMQGGVPTWSSTTPGTAHGILSVQHSDVTPTSTLIRGDLLVADASDKWNRLALGPAGYILYSDGADAGWSTTTVITALGAVTAGTWLADTIDIAHGGTGATTATSARQNLDLENIHKFAINSTGTMNWLWQSDGDGRGHWVATSSLGLGGTGATNVKFIGTTTAAFDGAFATSTLQGYQAANNICASEFTDSFFCRTYDIIVTIQKDSITDWSGTAWIAEGPPGYTSNSNDCNGWTSSSSVMMGAFWEFDSDGGGMGWLTNCSQTKPLACCREEQ